MNKETNPELLDLESAPKNSPKMKLEKVKILGMVRADYGAFDTGDIVEIPADIAKVLKAEGFAEAFTAEKSAKKEEEDF